MPTVLAYKPHELEREAQRVDRTPTEPQKLVGNYRKGHITVHGLDISIETPHGAQRTGTGPEGPWSVTMPYSYGYIRRTTGADGEQVDVIVGPDHASDRAFVVDQVRLDGTWDEHKCFLGFDHPSEVAIAYDAMFSDGSGPERRRDIHPMSIPEFKHWLAHEDTSVPLAKQALAIANRLLKAFDPSETRDASGKWAGVSDVAFSLGGAALGALAGRSQKAAEVARKLLASREASRLIGRAFGGKLEVPRPPRKDYVVRLGAEDAMHLGRLDRILPTAALAQIGLSAGALIEPIKRSLSKFDPSEARDTHGKWQSSSTTGQVESAARAGAHSIATASIDAGSDLLGDVISSHAIGPILRGVLPNLGIPAHLAEPGADLVATYLAAGLQMAAKVLKLVKFDESEARDESGRWTSGGASGLVILDARERSRIENQMLGDVVDRAKYLKAQVSDWAARHPDLTTTALIGLTALPFGSHLAPEAERAYGKLMTPKAFAAGAKADPKAIRHVLSRMSRRVGRERMLMVTPGGIMQDVVGGESSVQFEPHPDAFKPGAVMLHNHPSAHRGAMAPPPSPEDMHTIRRLGARGVVYSRGGSVYNFSVPPASRHVVVEGHTRIVKMPDGTVETHIFSPRTKHEIQGALIDLAFNSMVRDLAKGGTINRIPKVARENIFAARQHGSMLALRDTGVIRYNWRWSKADKAKVLKLKQEVLAGYRSAMDALQTDGAKHLPEGRRVFSIPRIGNALDESALDFRPYDYRFFQKLADDDAHDLLRKAAEDPTNAEQSLAGRMASALAWIGDSLSGAVSSAAGSVESAVNALPVSAITTRLHRALSVVDPVFMGSAEGVSSRRPKIVAVDFDQRNAQVRDFLANYKMDLIQQITDSQQQTIHQIVSDGLAAGLPPAEMARNIRDGLGLTSYQAQNVLNFRDELENINDPGNATSALSRELRDQRYDRSIQNAITSGSDIPDDQVDTMVDAYKRRYIAYRATTIARTEALRASNLGAVAAAQSLIDSGDVPEGHDIQKTWMATMDNRTRETHRELNGQSVIGMDTPFISSSGAQLLYPHDPAAPAGETVACRCSLAINVVPTDGTST